MTRSGCGGTGSLKCFLTVHCSAAQHSEEPRAQTHQHGWVEPCGRVAERPLKPGKQRRVVQRPLAGFVEVPGG